MRFSLSCSATSARLRSTNSPIWEPTSFMTAIKPASRSLPKRDEIHRLALSVDLPVLRQLPVEGAAEAFEHPRRGLVPTRRRDERLGDREPRRLQNLGPLAVADVDRDGLEVHRLVIGAAHETHRQVDPDVLAVFARIPLLDP